MSDEWDWSSADEVRRHNRALDAQLLALFDEVRSDELLRNAGDDPWRPAENLAHIAEFPRYFARQLREWLTGDRVVVGRVAEHSADRNDAVVRAPDRDLDALRCDAASAFTEFAAALEDLRDEHLDATTHNVKYGEEPLRTFLQRYAVGHKAAHLEQLRRTLDRVRRDG